MDEQLKILLSLQNLEIRIDDLNQTHAALMQQSADTEMEAAASETGLQETKVSLDEMRKAYRSMESDVQSAHARLQKSEGTLRSVKTNREYQSLLKEIEDQKGRIWALEDAMLEYLENIEGREAELRLKSEECEAVRRRSAETQKALSLQRLENEATLELLRVERQMVLEKLRPDLMNKYLSIKSSVGFRVAVSVKNAVCSGCHMNIPPQMYNELQQRDDIVYCPHCQRMIYWSKEVLDPEKSAI